VPPVRDAIALRSRAERSRAEAIALHRMSYPALRLPVNQAVGAAGATQRAGRCGYAARGPVRLRRARAGAATPRAGPWGYAARPVCVKTASSTSLASREPSEGRSGVAEMRTTTSSPSSSSSVICGRLRTGVWMAESSRS
jgi:hypothetical protein